MIELKLQYPITTHLLYPDSQLYSLILPLLIMITENSYQKNGGHMLLPFFPHVYGFIYIYMLYIEIYICYIPSSLSLNLSSIRTIYLMLTTSPYADVSIITLVV